LGEVRYDRNNLSLPLSGDSILQLSQPIFATRHSDDGETLRGELFDEGLTDA
jgi:hypothetical protein